MKATDLTGQVFGRLTVLGRAGNAHGGQALWLCKCQCFQTVTVTGHNLRSVKTQSCGCLYRESRARVCLKMRQAREPRTKSKRSSSRSTKNKAWAKRGLEKLGL
jgi:hypothetical protein